MTTTVVFDNNSFQAQQFLNYVSTLPFATIIEEEKEQKSFEQAAAECNAISVDAFFDELNARIEKWKDNA